MRRLAVGSALALSACASANPRPAFDDLRKQAGTHAQAAWARTPSEADALARVVDTHLGAPLTVESAVAVAL
ncbi:MAG TPA: hypothetical protein VFQ51_14480, partial [Vicinamibacteria bacterium]|nr:hypothetical protein [Vicinamibacteria bacterium]